MIIVLSIASLSCLAQKKNAPQKISSSAFKNLLDSSMPAQVLDVRTPEEYSGGHIKDAVNMNIYDPGFLAKLETLDKKKPVLVYCKAGARSTDAANQMHKMGFTNIIELQGGIMSWEKENLPLETSRLVDNANLFTTKHFDSVLAANPKILVDFYAHWCGPCKMMEPSLKKLSKQYKNSITVYRINVDEAKDLASQLGIEALPFTTLYKNGKLLQSETGYLSYKELQALAKKLLK